MANIASAKKRARQGEKLRLHNASQRSIESKDKEAAQTAYQAAVPVIDAMVSKGIIHKNKAARHKSRLNNHVKAL